MRDRPLPTSASEIERNNRRWLRRCRARLRLRVFVLAPREWLWAAWRYPLFRIMGRLIRTSPEIVVDRFRHNDLANTEPERRERAADWDAAARWIEPDEAPGEEDSKPTDGWSDPPCEWEPASEDLERIADAWHGKYVVVYPPAPDAAKDRLDEDEVRDRP